MGAKTIADPEAVNRKDSDGPEEREDWGKDKKYDENMTFSIESTIQVSPRDL